MEIRSSLVTPLYMGSWKSHILELRPSGLKGAIRYWWRVTAANRTVETLRACEARIFGAVSGTHAGRSKVIISGDWNLRYPTAGGLERFAENLEDAIMVNAHGGNAYPISILDYLAYGKNTNSYFLPKEQFFTLRLRFHPSLSNEDRDSVILALAGLSEFGNVGGKARNGFGKIFFPRLDFDRAKLHDRLFSGDMAHYVSGSKKAVAFQSRRTYPTWQEALACMGRIYHRARVAIEEHGTHDTRQRSYIGMPINDDQSRAGQKAEIARSGLGRHAKPLFLSVYPEKNEHDEMQYRGRVILFPYRYLAGNNLNLNSERYIDLFGQALAALTDVFRRAAEVEPLPPPNPDA